ncbi:hypothetical protein [Bradyrhizobium sp. SZCCHNPS1003]|uniref:hypothetical protein n=1 Tax=Bradyrhizobium sp. SZCCHNPS1003 TaxID=3057330 RepID=UPI0028E19454|nr:hypothetical protein [Bradyrhizobium sp. SZCCHNPS1003]
MPWKLTTVADTQVPNGQILPGFNLQQERKSPSVRPLFEDTTKASKARDLMQQILDSEIAQRFRSLKS